MVRTKIKMTDLSSEIISSKKRTEHFKNTERRNINPNFTASESIFQKQMQTIDYQIYKRRFSQERLKDVLQAK
jgi:hypothetical protein